MPDTDAWAAARVPGTCGELAQGYLDGEHVIVTAPIDRYATAVAVAAVGCPDRLPLDRQAPAGWQAPARRFPKMARALALAAQAGWLDKRGRVLLHSALPRGKGLGSSTADAAAGVAAACQASRRVCEPGALGQLLATLEPTDGSMHRGVALFASRTGRLLESLPPLDLAVGIVDWGGEVDTVQFHKHPPPSGDVGRQQAAFSAIIQGLRAQDPAAVGWGASQSALAHQRILPKPGLEELHRWVLAAGGYGLCVAHTGTIAGLLFSPSVDWQATSGQALRHFPHLAWLGPARLGSGGIWWHAVRFCPRAGAGG